MSNVTLPGTGQQVEALTQLDGSKTQVVLADVDRASSMSAAQFLQYLAPFPEAGVLVRVTGTMPISGSINLSTTSAPSTFSFDAATGIDPFLQWQTGMRSLVA